MKGNQKESGIHASFSNHIPSLCILIALLFSACAPTTLGTSTSASSSLLMIGIQALLGFAVGRIASKKGYSFFGFFVFGFVLFIVGIIVALCLKDKNKSRQEESLTPGDNCNLQGDAELDSLENHTSDVSTKEGAIICPHCGAKISDDSAFCSNCGASIKR